ncbi:hypothetical protein LJB42_002719 [Komagataella kurtzmanii]|nr:hypothetical protein LJB42_002719 [Komagataella kurtzmanii]
MPGTVHIFNELSTTDEDLSACSYSSWYRIFSENVVSPAKIVEVPDSFIEYISKDSIHLPGDDNNNVEINDDNEYSDWSDAEETFLDPSENFSEFHSKVQDVITQYSHVAPKLNWSAPRDATWIMMNNTMRCSSVNDVYLLLNSSNYVAHDLKLETSIKYELVLRKWVEINPALEFRCFVRDGKLIGISQRDLNYYNYLDSLKDVIESGIKKFLEETVSPKFPLKNYVIDVYFPRPFTKMYIVDFNPFNRSCDSLLFTWHELIIATHLDFRLVTEHDPSRFAAKEHSENQVPKDIVDASLDSAAMAELAQKWNELMNKEEP